VHTNLHLAYEHEQKPTIINKALALQNT